MCIQSSNVCNAISNDVFYELMYAIITSQVLLMLPFPTKIKADQQNHIPVTVSLLFQPVFCMNEITPAFL